MGAHRQGRLAPGPATRFRLNGCSITNSCGYSSRMPTRRTGGVPYEAHVYVGYDNASGRVTSPIGSTSLGDGSRRPWVTGFAPGRLDPLRLRIPRWPLPQHVHLEARVADLAVPPAPEGRLRKVDDIRGTRAQTAMTAGVACRSGSQTASARRWALVPSMDSGYGSIDGASLNRPANFSRGLGFSRLAVLSPSSRLAEAHTGARKCRERLVAGW